MEWEMFHTVQNMGGPAACQQDRKTFETMRSSQILSWSGEGADSYLEDLRRAKADKRNLMEEKYARMMEHTSPADFRRRIAPHLPELDEEAPPLIDRLTQMAVGWMEQVAAKYPSLGARGRPIRATADNEFTTSFETYSRGELATYSLKTLRLLENHYLRLAARGDNPAEDVLRHTVACYGFHSLEEAETAQRKHDEGLR